MSARDSPRRGRPPKTSLQDIVDTAVAQLTAEPDKPLSLHRIARALDITPMAIYHYAADRDELLQAVTNHMLQDLQPEVPDQPWPEQLRYWALSLRDYFLDRPALLNLLGWQQHVASAWLSQLAILARILRRAGLAGAPLADTVQWVSNTVMGAIFMEIAGKQSGFKVSKSDIRKLPQEDAVPVLAMMEHLWQKNARTVFAEGVDRIVLAVSAGQQ